MQVIETFDRTDLFLDNDTITVIAVSKELLDVCVQRIRKDAAGNAVAGLAFDRCVSKQDLAPRLRGRDLTSFTPGTTLKRGNGYCYITE